MLLLLLYQIFHKDFREQINRYHGDVLDQAPRQSMYRGCGIGLSSLAHHPLSASMGGTDWRVERRGFFGGSQEGYVHSFYQYSSVLFKPNDFNDLKPNEEGFQVKFSERLATFLGTWETQKRIPASCLKWRKAGGWSCAWPTALGQQNQKRDDWSADSGTREHIASEMGLTGGRELGCLPGKIIWTADTTLTERSISGNEVGVRSNQPGEKPCLRQQN